MKEKKKKIIISISLACVLAAAGIAAYFADGDQKDNVFEIGEVSLDLTEKWTPGQIAVPGETIPKEPSVKNDGINDEFIVLQVYIPKKNIELANEDGTRAGKKETELFSFETDPAWIQIGNGIDGKDPETGDICVIRTYAYGTSEHATVLNPGKTTTPLFKKIRYCNAIESDALTESVKNINIEAYGIQTNDIPDPKTGANTDRPDQLIKVIKNQRPETPVPKGLQ